MKITHTRVMRAGLTAAAVLAAFAGTPTAHAEDDKPPARLAPNQTQQPPAPFSRFHRQPERVIPPGEAYCPVEVSPDQPIFRGVGAEGGTGGGMAGNGWDGAGLNAATIYYHIENLDDDMTASEIRTAYRTAMQAWADVVRITWVEIPVPNRNQAVDWAFTSGDHCAFEAAECGDPDCPFGSGTLAHAGFPPGVNSQCVNPMAETWSGNVHTNTAFSWELDNAAGSGPFSLTAVSCHEVGHGIGLTHSSSPDIMKPSFASTEAFSGLSANDIANVRAGYATGTGSVITLESNGVWVNDSYVGTEWGTVALPFNTFSEGINGVPEGNRGVTLHCTPAVYDWGGLISKRVDIQPWGVGSVVIR